MVEMLTKAYKWGWIDDAYLDQAVALGMIAESNRAEITGPQNIVDINIKRGEA